MEQKPRVQGDLYMFFFLELTPLLLLLPVFCGGNKYFSTCRTSILLLLHSPGCIVAARSNLYVPFRRLLCWEPFGGCVNYSASGGVPTLLHVDIPIWTGGAIGDGCEGHTPGNSSPASQMVLHTSVPEVRRPSSIRHPFVFRRVCPLL